MENYINDKTTNSGAATSIQNLMHYYFLIIRQNILKMLLKTLQMIYSGWKRLWIAQQASKSGSGFINLSIFANS